MAVKIKRKVLVVSPNLTNRKVWCIELECGHANWIVRKHMPPSGGLRACEKCEAEAEAKGRPR